MKITLESTTKLVTLDVDGASVPARIWEGVTEGGIAVHCYVTFICVRSDDDTTAFEREFVERHPRLPSPDLAGIPLRLIL
jgi:hypothetical protein